MTERERAETGHRERSNRARSPHAIVIGLFVNILSSSTSASDVAYRLAVRGRRTRYSLASTIVDEHACSSRWHDGRSTTDWVTRRKRISTVSSSASSSSRLALRDARDVLQKSLIFPRPFLTSGRQDTGMRERGRLAGIRGGTRV